MALVLAMQPGRSFYVGDTQVEVVAAEVHGEVTVKVHGKNMDHIYHLTENKRTELLPSVFAQLGLGSGPNTLKIAVEAPRSVRILRDSLYEADDGRD